MCGGFPDRARGSTGQLGDPFLFALTWIVVLFMDDWREFQGVNAGFVAELHERFRHDPASVDTEARAFFERAPAPPVYSPAPAHALAIEKVVAAVNLAESIRKFGNLTAQLDPLGSKLPGDPSLLPEAHGITEEDLRRLPGTIIASSVAEGASNALEVIEALQKIYCTTAGTITRTFAPRKNANGSPARPNRELFVRPRPD